MPNLKLFIAAALALPMLTAPAQAGSEVNVYSYREPQLIEPLLKAFEAETGITVNTIFASEGLVERIAAEGANSPADVLLTAESGLLVQAQEAGISAPLTSDAITAAVPAPLREATGKWIGLTQRARVLFVSKERVSQAAFTYEELAEPKWKGKLCARSGQHTYNIALFASMIAHLGPEKAEAWLKGVKANLARKPSGSDRDQIKSVFSGECDIAIGNTYYMGQMLTNERQPEQKDWAAAVRIVFPNGADRGTHVNISGAALMASAPDRDNGVKLIEYLASADAQKLYAKLNHEYPVRPGVEASDLVKSWGILKPDPLSLTEIAKLRRAASELVDKVGFDEGPGT
jgi:iron(III) transport system substrate-binding protein